MLCVFKIVKCKIINSQLLVDAYPYDRIENEIFYKTTILPRKQLNVLKNKITFNMNAICKSTV